MGYSRRVLPRRSGAPSRFLVFRAPQHWARPLRLIGINLIFGLTPVLTAIVGFAAWGGAALEALVDPQDAIRRLSRPLSPEEAARGEQRVSGRIAGGEVCLVFHEHSEKDWVEDWHAVDSEGASLVVVHAEGNGVPAPGETLPVTWDTDAWEPHLVRLETSRREHWEARLRGIPSGGRVLEGCLRPGDRLFVDVTPRNQLPRFFMDSALQAPVLTAGDGTPRLRLAELAATRTGHTAPLAFAVVLSLLCLWRLVAARPIADALVRRLSQPLVPTAARPALVAVAVTPLALAGVLWLHTVLLTRDAPAWVDRWGWAAADSSAMVALVVALRMGDRRAELAAAAELVKKTKGRRQKLDRAREGEALGLDVTVAADAPEDRGLLTGKPHAHWFVEVTRVYKDSSAPAPHRAGPLIVPVVPVHGQGAGAFLDLTHVAADLRAVRRVVGPFRLRRGKYAPLVGEAPHGDSTYVFEERFLDRGERLHVLGRVLRFASVEGQQVPVLGGTATEPLVIHAGSRRSLLRGLRTERHFLTLARAASLGVTLGMAALALYLGSR
jgi:hypothetical protein